MLRKKISEKKEALNELRKAAESFETREAELEQAIAEAETDEQKAVVEEAVDNFEAEKQKTGTIKVHYRLKLRPPKMKSEKSKKTHLRQIRRSSERRLRNWKPE